MKKIIIVNNNMKVGGVQKSLYNLLWAVSEEYDITLYLFSKSGEYIDQLPPTVEIQTCTSLFRFLGVSQAECGNRISDKLTRGVLAALCKLFGRPFVMRLISLSQKSLPEAYDVAISYLQNGNIRSFYGGVNEFVLQKVKARKKAAFLHCDYVNCGANHPKNNQLYALFDCIAACSDGCRNAFTSVVPSFESKCMTVRNFHRQRFIEEMSLDSPSEYEAGRFHVLVVGRLAHEKAVDRAIKAAAFVLSQGVPVSLHIIGDGNMMGSLRELVSSLHIENDVIFCGEQSNPYRFMNNADLLLVSSYHEAAPIVIDEAYILGLPVLTVETTSSREMVLDRKCGWVCENSQEGLNQGLLTVLSNPALLDQTKQALKSRTVNNAEAFRQFQSMIGGFDDDAEVAQQQTWHN